MKKYRITYKVGNLIETLDVCEVEVDEGFVTVWIDGSHKDAAPDVAINANSVYKIERIKEEGK